MIKSFVNKFLKTLYRTLLILVVVIFLITVINLIKKPSLDREWSEDSMVLPDISISDSIVEIKNLRDWRYEIGNVISKQYYDESFDSDKIKNTWLVLNPLGKWEGVAHFFFVFEFESGQSVSMSIEARREVNEKYSSLKGVLNNYELWYAWGSSADFMTRRALFYNDDLYIYPLLISQEISRSLFIDLAKTTEELETVPKFYNTVTSNCTNLLAKAGNNVRPGSIPFHYSRLFTGFADNQLYDLELIPHDKPFDQIFKEARVDEQIRDIFSEKKEYSEQDFWKSIDLNNR